MFYRQKLLLALIEAFGGRLNNRDLQKYLFLYTQKCQQDKSYDFVPYKYGCFSFQSYADRRNLVQAGHLAANDEWVLNETGYLKGLKKGDDQKILTFYDRYKDTSGNELIKTVYKQYPYYAINSEIAGKLMNAEELEAIEAQRPDNENFGFFTIGYEGHSFEHYLNRLIQNDIKLLCDVRRNPLSRKYGFSKKTLSETLAKLGIKYIHIPELGIISEKRQQLNNQADYDRLFDEYERTTLHDNEPALEQLRELLKQHKRVAITCFEADSCQCHRGRVAKELMKMPNWDYPVEHI